MNTDFLKAFPHYFQPESIYLVGCGGTGSYVAPTIARLAKHLQKRGKEITVYFIDPDLVEEKNIWRQNFCYAEVGANKAEALTARLNHAWGLNIKAIPHHFKSTRFSHYQTNSLIVGCVDNPEGRQEISRCRAAWLDSGNHFNAGQVLYGNCKDGKAIKSGLRNTLNIPYLPSPGLQEPQLLESQSLQPAVKRSCADLIEADLQSMVINQAMAAIVSTYLYELLLNKGLKYHATYLNLATMGTTVNWNTKKSLARYSRRQKS
ncbi:MAG: ThiF family adenylyltransferase [Acidobacteria bacterium]|nr:ThiF family adenylyltransferase [Acidobacteriota bacterium]